MMMPGREYQAQPSRFGFNGKENDNEVKGFGNQQDYGMRIYDTRIGKFLSLDPMTKNFPWYTPYQFAGNSPIYALDLDGAEEMSYMDQYKYDGSWGWFDWAKAVPNAAGRIWNSGVVDTWNSGVYTVKSIGRGTYTQDVARDIKNAGQGIKNMVVQEYNFLNKPVKQQLKEAWDYYSSPKALEDALVIGFDMYTGYKVSGVKGNLLKPVISEIIVPSVDDIFTISIATRGKAETYALLTKYKSYFNINDFGKPNNKGFDLISSIEEKVVDVTTTTAQKFSVSDFYGRLRKLSDAANQRGYGSILQIYIKEGQYTAAQLSELRTKLDDVIKGENLNSSYSIDVIKNK